MNLHKLKFLFFVTVLWIGAHSSPIDSASPMTHEDQISARVGAGRTNIGGNRNFNRGDFNRGLNRGDLNRTDLNRFNPGVWGSGANIYTGTPYYSPYTYSTANPYGTTYPYGTYPYGAYPYGSTPSTTIIIPQATTTTPTTTQHS
ncbi:MAG: hypothetical protein HWD61_01995 [Parachlamydiaceae bacterium]|nr:MAG: hypothetical protein HWD61_01995 [Parachlamydiaceae bacterium]